MRTATFAELDTTTLYKLLRLRVDVFVVEQSCPYPELDGLDTEPDTVHLWLEEDGEILGYLRILAGRRIGRVCVAKRARGGGYAGRLMAGALALLGDRECVLDAQSHLVDFYRRYGFAPDGPEYVEDGIPHVPMRRLR